MELEDATTTEDTTLILSSIAPHPSVDIGRLVMQIASFVIGSLGLLGNGCVILVCLIHPLRGVTNILICNQSLVDFFSSLVFVLRYGIFYNTPLPPGAKIATFVCRFWISEYPLWALGVASTANLIYITMERYVAVIYPIAYRNKLTTTKAKLLAILPWIIGWLHELAWAMSHKVENGICFHEWWSEKIGFVIGVIVPVNHYVLPLLIMAFVYIRILFKLRSSRFATEDKHNKGKKRSQDVTSRASKNVIKTMFVVSLTYLICWGPNEVLYFYNNMGGYVNWNGPLYYYTVISALCNMCVNPFIYTFKYQDFRVKLGKLVTPICFRACHKENDIHQTHSVPVSDVSSRV